MNLESLRGKYAGKVAVILGAGPSLRFANDSILKNRVSIAINDAITKFSRSDFYFTMDPTMLQRRHWKGALESLRPMILKKCPEYEALFGNGRMLPPERTCLVPWRPDGPNGERSYRVSESDADFIIGGSSAHSAVNFAVVLGCRTVYLVGCDCRAYEGRRYFWQWDTDKEYTGGMADQSPDVAFGYRDADADKILAEYVTKCWANLRQANPEIDIVDASGGLLGDVLHTEELSALQAG